MCTCRGTQHTKRYNKQLRLPSVSFIASQSCVRSKPNTPTSHHSAPSPPRSTAVPRCCLAPAGVACGARAVGLFAILPLSRMRLPVLVWNRDNPVDVESFCRGSQGALIGFTGCYLAAYRTSTFLVLFCVYNSSVHTRQVGIRYLHVSGAFLRFSTAVSTHDK